ncbi:hypothetical protein FC46_GL000305 [Lactobacillus kalixensis DSM 16043]|uniref:Uncharacterized protein n=1 Tax=Lactobacillus kalixensis DSM 16043 TaxID=1423763 RepID=A0A0R1UA29_9LACO|nr:hypothetical protein FC46_GL000305 [Lactobacillus kalixensis DSM 16043]
MEDYLYCTLILNVWYLHIFAWITWNWRNFIPWFTSFWVVAWNIWFSTWSSLSWICWIVREWSRWYVWNWVAIWTYWDNVTNRLVSYSLFNVILSYSSCWNVGLISVVTFYYRSVYLIVSSLFTIWNCPISSVLTVRNNFISYCINSDCTSPLRVLNNICWSLVTCTNVVNSFLNVLG